MYLLFSIENRFAESTTAIDDATPSTSRQAVLVNQLGGGASDPIPSTSTGIYRKSSTCCFIIFKPINIKKRRDNICIEIKSFT